MEENNQQERFFFAAQSAMLFAGFLDNTIIGQLKNEVKEISEGFLGGIFTLQHGAEVDLFTRLLYYTPCLLAAGRTVGHDFCGFKLFRSVRNSTSSEGSAGTNSGSNAIGHLQKIDFLALAVLNAVLPYIHERKDVIYKKSVDFYQFLTAKEEGIDIFWRRSEEQSAEVEEENHELSHRSIFGIISTAVYHSILSIAQDTSTRLDYITTFMKDIHRCFFFATGRYLDLSLRLLNIRLLTTSQPAYKSSFRVLAWLLGFRISLFIYYAARVLFSEIDRELEASLESNGQSGGYDSSGAITINIAPGSKQEHMHSATLEDMADRQTRICALCMDTMTHPAVIPCGHFFCWKCIVSYGMSRNQDNEATADGPSGYSTTRNSLKCPVCRSEFPQQKIRALYSY